MKTKFSSVVIFAVCTLALNACASKSSSGGAPAVDLSVMSGQVNLVGQPQISWLKGTWVGDSQSSYAADSFVASGDGTSLTVTQRRQVGASGDTVVPYPTDCLFRSKANNYIVYEQGDASARYVILYSAQTVELLPDPNNGSACDAYVQRSQSLANANQYISGITVAKLNTLTQFATDQNEVYTRQ